jgi:hypothetical protein
VAKIETDQVTFIVEFEDGSTAFMSVYQNELMTGDHSARIIAAQKQTNGELRNGAIKSIRRAPV